MSIYQPFSSLAQTPLTSQSNSRLTYLGSPEAGAMIHISRFSVHFAENFLQKSLHFPQIL
jgi:hypothetical protein